MCFYDILFPCCLNVFFKVHFLQVLAIWNVPSGIRRRGKLVFFSLCLCILFFLSALARRLSHIWIWCSLVEHFKGTEFMWFPNLIALIVFPHPSIGGVDREVFKATIWLMYLFCLEGKTSPRSLWWVVTVKIARLQIYYRTFWASVLICGAISFPRLTSRLTDLSFSIHTKHLKLSQV